MRNKKKYYYLQVTWDEELGACLRLDAHQWDQYVACIDKPIALKGSHEIYLKVSLNHDKLSFTYSYDAKTWHHVAKDLNSLFLSDDHGHLAFTGLFYALSAQDLSGCRHPATFHQMSYRELD